MTNATATWLKFWSAAMTAVGLVFVLSAWPPLDWPARIFTDLAFWPLDGNPGLTSLEGRLHSVIGGGLAAAWCLLLGRLFAKAHRDGDRELVRLALASLVLWFVADSIASVAVGAWMNAIMNAAILAGFIVPLLVGGRHVGRSLLPGSGGQGE